MMMNEFNYASTMEESSYYYSVDDANDNQDQLRLMQLQEANDFADYDQAMYDAFDVDHQHQEYDYEYEYDDGNGYQDDDNDEIMWDDQKNIYYDQQYDDYDNQQDDEEEENHDDSALLRLILGVQMYLGETTTANRSKDDTPLMDLQYKMYTYMKLRAMELGMDTSSLY